MSNEGMDEPLGGDPLDDELAAADDQPDHGIERFEQEGDSLLGDAPESQPAPESEPAPESQPDRAGVEPDDMAGTPAEALPAESDAHLALYRRYRPDTFADVIGQEHVTEPLSRALANNRVNHAYLFSGPRGCGKTTSARILARCLNCEQGPTPTPCGECRSCRDLARGGPGSIDVIEIDAASHGGVDDARELRERAFFAPVHSRYKVYIVDEAHMVTQAGFNALLKLVEEPPPHVKFVFATTEPDKVIGTIRSRTHHYPFRLVPPKTLTTYLGSLCEAEGTRVDQAVLPLVVRAGAGSVRDSLSVLDQLLGGADVDGVSYEQAAALLGFTPETLLDEIVDAFAAGDGHGVFQAVDRIIEVGQDPRRFGEDLLRRFRDLVIVDAVPDAIASGLVDVPEDQADRLRAQASGMGAGELTRAAEVISAGLTDMRGTTAPRLHLELMCARVLLPGADVDDRGVHARLDRLERRMGMITDAAAAQPSEPAARPAPHATEDAGPAAPPARERGAPPPPPTGRQQPAPTEAGPVERRADGPDQPTPDSPEPTTDSAPTSRGGGGLRTAEFRQLWPQILDRIKVQKRFSWFLLTQNAQVVEVLDGVLTLAMRNQGARDNFVRGGTEDLLKEAIIDVVGVDLRIETIIDGGPGPSGRSGPGGGGRGSGGSGSDRGGRPPAAPDRVSAAPVGQPASESHRPVDPSPHAAPTSGRGSGRAPAPPRGSGAGSATSPETAPADEDPVPSPAAATSERRLHAVPDIVDVEPPPEDEETFPPDEAPFREARTPAPTLRAVPPPPPPTSDEPTSDESSPAVPPSVRPPAPPIEEPPDQEEPASGPASAPMSPADRARQRLAQGRSQRSAAPASASAPEDEYADFDPAELQGAVDAGSDYRKLLADYLGAEPMQNP